MVTTRNDDTMIALFLKRISNDMRNQPTNQSKGLLQKTIPHLKYSYKKSLFILKHTSLRTCTTNKKRGTQVEKNENNKCNNSFKTKKSIYPCCFC